jgi:hypothetical protein
MAILFSMTTVTVASPVSIEQLRQLAKGRFGDMVKAVVDIQRGVMVLDADLHADFYPDVEGDDWLEFDSMINLRPSLGNSSRGVDDAATRKQIADLVRKLVIR